jgi:hypothetical protein
VEIFIDNSGSHSHADFIVLAKRNYAFYLYKICLINVLTSIWSWVAFFQDANDISSKMAITLTLFLAMVAFLFVANGSLPKVAYLTSLDKFLVANFVFLYLVAFESFFAYILSVDRSKWYGFENVDLAFSLDKFSFVAIPSGYVFYHVLWLYSALKKRKSLESAITK